MTGGIALRTPLGIRPGQRIEDPYAMLEARFTPRTVFMEIGTDAAVALRAASYVERVYSIQVGQLQQGMPAPCNLRPVSCDGIRIPVPEATVDIAWSGDFMDSLSPEDAHEHLKSVRRSLVPGGEYLCATRASVTEAARRIAQAGFRAVRFYAGGMRVPGALAPLVPGRLLKIAALR